VAGELLDGRYAGTLVTVESPPRMRPSIALSLGSLSLSLACGDVPPARPAAAPMPVVATPPTAPSAAASPPVVLAPPITRHDDFHETLHGVDIVDPYRWLEEQDAPETRAWIEAQSAYTHGLLDGIPGREAIRTRLEQLLRLDSEGLPNVEGRHVFTWKRGARDDLWTYAVRDGIGGKDEVLLDPHPLSPDHTTALGVPAVSRDGKRLVYSLRRGGEDESELHVLDVDARHDLPDLLPRALYRGTSFDGDGRGFLYGLQDRAVGVCVKHHVLGTAPELDTEVFGAGYGPSDGVSGWTSENGRHTVFVVWHGWAKNEVFLKDAATGGHIEPVVRDLDGHFSPAFAGDRLIMKTDYGAPTGRIVEVDPRHPEPERWRTIVPAGPDAIRDWDLVGGKILVQVLHDVTSRLSFFDLTGARSGDVALPGLGTVSSCSGHWDSDDVFCGFTSYTVPWRALRLSAKTGAVTPWWTADVPFAADDYETEQVFFTSKDGTRVPMFLSHKKGLPRDGARPTLLYGYGGFDHSQMPGFSAWTAWLVEQGFVYAVANIRGGGEYGEEWHRAGMLEHKQNVFDDFIAAGEWLVHQGVTSPDKLAIQGGSNGGLLVGAALTQRPDLFRAVLCEFPDLDMVGYHRFKNNNPPALLEYGDASKPDQFKFLFAYSPYQRVTPGTRYPAVLLVTGDEDTRVPPLQARKMTARLQAATTSGRPVALLYDTKAGHAGGKPLTKSIEDQSLELAFLRSQLDVP
jgi:prolyl oligopeptidase